MNKNIWVYDIETLKSIFCVVFKNIYTGEVKRFEISRRKNELSLLISFLESYNLRLIGFNNLFFDYPVLHFLLTNKNRLLKLDKLILIGIIYEFAQKVIESGRSEDNKFKYSIADWNILIPQIDLFKIWHFDNKAKMTSLKKVEFAIRWNNVQDMPYEHYEILTEDFQLDEVISYCENDVNATLEFYKITIGDTELVTYKNKNKIQLRLDVQKKTNLKCLNWNDVKIGDEINKKRYLNKTGLVWQDIKGINTVRNEIKFLDCIADYIKFESEELNLFLEKLKSITVSGTKSEFSEKIMYKGVEFTFGQGGIHTVDSARIIITIDGWKLEDRDVGSMYPNTLKNRKLYPAHLGIEWLIGIEETIDERLYNKALGNDNNLVEADKRAATNWAETLKLSLNGGGYGKTGEANSWQYDPLVMLTTTITNQLSLLMLAEKYLNHEFKVISANTDGIVLYYPKDQQLIVDKIDKEWMELTNYNLEYTEYSKFIQTSVNDYITLKPNGKLKFKGDFEIDKEIHKNHSMKIVPIALKEYYIKNIPIEDTIRNHKDILDFCKCANMIGDNVLYERTHNQYGEEEFKKLSKTTRYYVSVNGNSLIKKLPPLKNDKLEQYRKENPAQLDLFHFLPDVKVDIDRESNIEAGYVCTVYNKLEENKSVEDVNFDYYINECNKIINKVKEYKLEEN